MQEISNPYHDDPDVRVRIDQALCEASYLMTRKGTRQQYTDGTLVRDTKVKDRPKKTLVDDLSEEGSAVWYKAKENSILKSVFHEDPEFMSKLIEDELQPFPSDLINMINIVEEANKERPPVCSCANPPEEGCLC